MVWFWTDRLATVGSQTCGNLLSDIASGKKPCCQGCNNSVFDSSDSNQNFDTHNFDNMFLFNPIASSSNSNSSLGDFDLPLPGAGLDPNSILNADLISGPGAYNPLLALLIMGRNYQGNNNSENSATNQNYNGNFKYWDGAQMQSNNSQVTSGRWSKPIKGGRITSQFGHRKAPKAGASTEHKGIDIGAPCNTPVYAPENGTVTGAYINGGFGKFISLNHGKDKDGNSLVSWYGHLNRWLVSPGQKVSKGQLIGYVGSTGVSTGPHLHFQVMKNGSPVNPIEYVGALG